MNNETAPRETASRATSPRFSTGRLLRSVLIIISAAMASGFFQSILMNTGYMASWIEQICGLGAAAAGLFPTVAEIVSIVSILICGILALKIPLSRIFFAGAAACIAGLFGMYFFPSVPGLIIFYVILFGLGTSGVAYTIIFGALLAILDKKYAAAAAGVLSCCGTGVSIFLFPLVTGITASLPVRSVFLILGIAGLCTLPLFYIIAKQKKSPAGSPADADTAEESGDSAESEALMDSTEKISLKSVAKELLTSKLFYMLCLFFFLYGICDRVAFASIPWFFQLEFGTSGAFALSFFDIVYVAGAVACGLMITKFKSKMLFLGVMFAVLAFIFSPVVSPETMTAVVIILVPAALAVAAVGPLLSLTVADIAGAAKFSAVYGLLYVIKQTGAAAEAALAGLGKSLFPDVYNINPFLWVAAAAAAFLAILYGIRMMRQKKIEAEGGKLQE